MSDLRASRFFGLGSRRILLIPLALTAFACGGRIAGDGSPVNDMQGDDPGSAGADAATPPSDAIVVLASGRAQSIAVDSTSVYWTDAFTNSVMKVPLDGGSPTTLASGQLLAQGIALDSTSVYWTNLGDGTVSKMPIEGGPITVLATAQSSPWGIAVDATAVYWTDGAAAPELGAVMTVPIGGGSTTTLASAQSGPGAVAVDATSVYWTNGSDGTVMKVSLDGGDPTTLASGQVVPAAIAVDATHVYWTTNGSSPGGVTTLTGDQLTGSVASVLLDGSGLATLASAQNRPEAIAVDRDGIVWANQGDGASSLDGQPPTGDGALMMLAARGEGTALASSQAGPTCVALSSTHVYWGTSGGAILARHR